MVSYDNCLDKLVVYGLSIKMTHSLYNRKRGRWRVKKLILYFKIVILFA